MAGTAQFLKQELSGCATSSSSALPQQLETIIALRPRLRPRRPGSAVAALACARRFSNTARSSTSIGPVSVSRVPKLARFGWAALLLRVVKLPFKAPGRMPLWMILMPTGEDRISLRVRSAVLFLRAVSRAQGERRGRRQRGKEAKRNFLCIQVSMTTSATS